MKVREVIETKLWQDGKGFINTQIIKNEIIEIPYIDRYDIDWSFWEKDKTVNYYVGQDLNIVVRYYAPDIDPEFISEKSPIIKYSAWQSEVFDEE